MAEIIVRNSTISGLHVTKTSLHSDITLNVYPDSTLKDKNAMKVVLIPPLNKDLALESLDLVAWPKNVVGRGSRIK